MRRGDGGDRRVYGAAVALAEMAGRRTMRC